MASEEDVDIEGDFDVPYSISSDILDDFIGPSSKIPLLQPEICQNPWPLEQSWSLDECTDERSRVLIESMIQEEQHYLDGGLKHSPELSTANMYIEQTKSETVLKQQCRVWNDEEKDLFQKSLEIFGKRWKKIAEIIPNKSVEQVKHYGMKYLRNMKNAGASEATKSSTPKFKQMENLQDMEKQVTTGETTIPVVQEKLGRNRFSKTKTNNSARNLSSREQTLSVSDDKFPDAQIVRITSTNTSDSEEVDIDVEENIAEDKSENFCLTSDNSSQELKFGNIEESDSQHICSSKGMSLLQLQTKHKDTLDNSNNFINKDSSLISDLNFNGINGGDYITPILETDSSLEEKLVPNMKTIPADLCERSEEFIRKIITNSLLHTDKEPYPHMLKENSDNCKQIFLAQIEETSTENFDQFGSCIKNVEHDVNLGSTDSCPIDCNETYNKDSQNTGESSEEEHIDEFPIQGSDGKVFCLPNPKLETFIVRTDVSAQEKEIFLEFFDGRPGLKAEDKYLEIRNGILDMWEKTKPNFLNKTVIRNGLRKIRCDVNLLGRVHAYLEQIGAVNFGCEQVQYKKKQRRSRKIKKNYEVQLSRCQKEELSKRRRKVRDMFGTWIDEKELEGRTIDHDKNEVSESGHSTKAKKTRKVNSSYDPFQLIPCNDFGSDVAAPFAVEIEIEAMIVMDVHAHLSKTEVIGLLGGEYRNDVLYVRVAEPCNSLSTNMQCEMDPVSQTEAKEKIVLAGLRVVGWYHSHPTFEPNPSVRDIETQTNFQNWFSSGNNPFIGVIVSPYSQPCNTLRSQVRSLVIASYISGHTNIGQPFQFNHMLVQTHRDMKSVVEKIQLLISKYCQLKNRVEMLSYFKQSVSATCSEKLCSSLASHFDAAKTTEEKTNFLKTVAKIIQEKYSPVVDGDTRI